MEAARYDVLVELRHPLDTSGALADFVAAWDRALGEVNVEYASKRASARLHAPLLFVMRPGWSERACRREIAGGRREAQHKWSALRSEWDDVSRTEVVHRSAARELGGPVS